MLVLFIFCVYTNPDWGHGTAAALQLSGWQGEMLLGSEATPDHSTWTCRAIRAAKGCIPIQISTGKVERTF